MITVLAAGSLRGRPIRPFPDWMLNYNESFLLVSAMWAEPGPASGWRGPASGGVREAGAPASRMLRKLHQRSRTAGALDRAAGAPARGTVRKCAAKPLLTSKFMVVCSKRRIVGRCWTTG